MNYLKTVKLIFFIIIFNSSICTAQDKIKLSPDKNLWLSSTVGFMAGSEYSGFLADFSIGYANKSKFYSIEYFDAADIRNFAIFTETEENALNGINLLYGTMKRDTFYKVTYVFGLSVIESFHSKRVNDLQEKSHRYTVGLPLSAQLVLTPIQILAIGIKGYINFNTENTIMGAGLGFYFGKVR